jgi:hypothetical protein
LGYSIDIDPGSRAPANEMKAKIDRIHFKSLAGILALQEKFGAECGRRWASLPAVKAAAAK